MDNRENKVGYSMKLDPDLLRALRVVKRRDGISESEQIRRGIRLWLAKQGGAPKRRT
jgi:hypothetical protein